MQIVRHFRGQKYGTAENASIRNREDAYEQPDIGIADESIDSQSVSR